MAEDSEQTTGGETVQVPARAVRTAEAFVAAHGAPARAVVENVGRSVARVVLVGADGTMGDVVVPDAATGEALVARVADLTPADWDRETVSATKIGAAHRRKMAGPRAGR